MLIKTQLLNNLKDLGINSYETKLWTALLSRGVATAGELSDIANVPRSRTYDVLESLERKGFIITKIGKPIKYIALSPEQVLERVHKNILDEVKMREDNLLRIEQSNVLDELNTLFENGIEKVDSFELSGTLKGRKNIYNHLVYLIKNAKESVLIITTEQGMKRKTEHLGDHLRSAKSRGVSVLISAPSPALATAAVQKLAGIAKFSPTAHALRLCVVDSRDAVLILTDDNDINPAYDNAIWVNSPFFSAAFQKLVTAPRD